jgi:hypothetical protein
MILAWFWYAYKRSQVNLQRLTLSLPPGSVFRVRLLQVETVLPRSYIPPLAYNGGSAMTQALRAIWPSYNNIANQLPESAGFTTKDMLSFFILSVLSLLSPTRDLTASLQLRRSIPILFYWS